MSKIKNGEKWSAILINSYQVGLKYTQTSYSNVSKFFVDVSSYRKKYLADQRCHKSCAKTQNKNKC